MENLKDKTHTSCASGKMIKGSTVDEERKRAQLARLRGNLGGGELYAQQDELSFQTGGRKRHRPDPWERWNARDAGPV